MLFWITRSLPQATDTKKNPMINKKKLFYQGWNSLCNNKELVIQTNLKALKFFNTLNKIIVTIHILLFCMIELNKVHYVWTFDN